MASVAPHVRRGAAWRRRAAVIACVVGRGSGLARPYVIQRHGFDYKFVAAAGMYRRVGEGAAPQWCDPEASQERLYDDRGWGVIGREGADETDESAADFVGDGEQYRPAFETFAAMDDDSVPLSISSLGFDVSPRPPDAAGLPELSAAVLLRGKTEAPHGGVTADGVAWDEILDAGAPVVLRCAASGVPVFDSADAFRSSSGWPSFRRPIAEDHVSYRPDGSAREVLCAASRAHLGHAIDEGAAGVRYCINAAALAVGATSPVAPPSSTVPETLRRDLAEFRTLGRARFAMGCYWSVQALFDKVPGVVASVAGVSRGAEAVEVDFDDAVVAYEDLVRLFFASHDPTPFRAAGDKAHPDGKYRCEVHALDAVQFKTAQGVRNDVQGRIGAVATPIIDCAAGGAFVAAPDADQAFYRKRKGGAAPTKFALSYLARLPVKLED